jgi:hypothetical protein
MKKILTEDDILDYIFQTLYYSLDNNELDFEKEILASSLIELNEKQVEHLRELMMNSGLVNQSVGFRKSGKVYLNARGIQGMKKVKSYKGYLLEDSIEGGAKIMSHPSADEASSATIQLQQPISKDEFPLRDYDMAH